MFNTHKLAIVLCWAAFARGVPVNPTGASTSSYPMTSSETSVQEETTVSTNQQTQNHFSSFSEGMFGESTTVSPWNQQQRKYLNEAIRFSKQTEIKINSSYRELCFQSWNDGCDDFFELADSTFIPSVSRCLLNKANKCDYKRPLVQAVYSITAAMEDVIDALPSIDGKNSIALSVRSLKFKLVNITNDLTVTVKPSQAPSTTLNTEDTLRALATMAKRVKQNRQNILQELEIC